MKEQTKKVPEITVDDIQKMLWDRFNARIDDVHTPDSPATVRRRALDGASDDVEFFIGNYRSTDLMKKFGRR